MNKTKLVFFLLIWLPSALFARQIDTFYGPIDVQEPVLLELIEHPFFQRLKHIHQYGVAYYTTHQEEYTRYDHSLGVFALLRANNVSLEEQIAGLLHDVSHTAFSHVGDWIFGKENQDKDYQNSIHSIFLEKSGLADVLKKYHFSVEQILPKEELFPALENTLPNLCADRIDYNIQGAYYQGFITYEEALIIFEDFRFVEGRWVSRCPALMEKMVRFSLFMTQNCWGSPANYVTSRWLADAILRGIELHCISYAELHFGTDQIIWDKLMLHTDNSIKQKMKMVLESGHYFSVLENCEEADLLVKSKFRGIDPWIAIGTTCARLTEINKEIASEFERTKLQLTRGWPIKFFPGGVHDVNNCKAEENAASMLAE